MAEKPCAIRVFRVVTKHTPMKSKHTPIKSKYAPRKTKHTPMKFNRYFLLGNQDFSRYE